MADDVVSHKVGGAFTLYQTRAGVESPGGVEVIMGDVSMFLLAVYACALLRAHLRGRR